MEQPRSLDVPGLVFGGDYNPEQWPEEKWREDVRLMNLAGVNLVTVGVFSWGRLEPREGVFDFEWLDRVLDLLHAHGIKADLATATASPPAWLVRAHPEMLPVDAFGTRLEFGSRQSYCPSSPVWREQSVRLCRMMATRYKDHPALAMWHVSNEYGDELSRCWCPTSAQAFRKWLQVRYRTIDALNEAWGTCVWSQIYASFEQIEPPRATPGPGNPSQRLDFERFSSDALVQLFDDEAAVLREVTPGVPVTTNFMGVCPGVDYWELAAREDIVSNDAYPDPADDDSGFGAGFGYSFMRSAKRGPWLLLESAPSAVNWRDVNVPKTTARRRLDAMQAIAHGSEGVMYFQWRQARQGAEQHHSAMVGHRGEASRTFHDTRSLGAELAALADVRGTTVHAEAAMIVDWDSWWASSALESLPSQRLAWAEQARRWHQAAAMLGVAVDIVRAEGPFDPYRVVLIPGLYLATPAQAAALTRFVETGGTLLVGGFSGVVDETETVHSGGPPGPLRNLLGVEIDEPWPLSDGATGAVELDDAAFATHLWHESIVAAAGTAVLARYRGGPLDGRPALTEHACGQGQARYLSCVLDDAGLSTVLQAALARAGVVVREAPSRVEVVTRTDGQADYTFWLNHSEQEQTLDTPAGAIDVLRGIPLASSTTVAAMDVLIARSPIRSEGSQ